MGEEFRCEKRRVSSETEKHLSVASLEFPAQENPCPTPRCARRRTDWIRSKARIIPSRLLLGGRKLPGKEGAFDVDYRM